MFWTYYNELTYQYGELPGLLHDRAIVESVIGDPGEAVTLMQRALYLKPGNRKLMQSLLYIEKQTQFTRTASPIPALVPFSALHFLDWRGVNILFLILAWVFIIQKEKKFLPSGILYPVSSSCYRRFDLHQFNLETSCIRCRLG